MSEDDYDESIEYLKSSVGTVQQLTDGACRKSSRRIEGFVRKDKKVNRPNTRTRVSKVKKK